MKSIMRRSLAAIMVLAMLLMMAVPAMAADAHVHTDNNPCEHAGTDAVNVEEVAATCQQNGGKWHTCTICGDVWVTDEVAKDPNAHNMAGESTTIEATCWRDGYTTGDYCTNEGCDYNTGITNIVPKYSHDPEAENNCLEIKEKTLADCLEGGVIIYECRFKDEPADELGSCTYNGEKDVEEGPQGHRHSLLSTGYQAPTCHESGWVTLDCTKCDDTFKVAIAAKGHNFVTQQFVSSSCTLAGYDAGAYCDNEWLVWGEDGVATKVTCSAYYNTTKGIGSVANPVEPETDLDAEALRHDATSQHNMQKVTDETYKGEAAYQEANCDPSAESDGWQWYKCADCDADRKEALTPVHKDDGTYSNVVKPDCTTKGYTEHICSICDKKYIDENSYTAAQHAWASTGENVVYTFVDEEGYTYVKEGDVRKLADVLDVKIDFIPYMVPAAELATDAVAQQLIADGYSQVAWTVMTEVKCGQQGEYVHKCSKCDVKGFLTIVVDHVWDGNWDTVEMLPATCTSAGGYYGTCANENCEAPNKRFILSAAMVGANNPDYDPDDYAPTGHMSNNGPVLTKDPATGKFVYPVVNEVPATCIATGTPAFNYCNNENCPEGLENYEAALEEVKDTLEMVPHQYYDENGKPLVEPNKIEPSCMYGGFYIAKCATCGLQYNLDATVNGGDTNAYNHRIQGNADYPEFGEYDGVSHVYPDYYGTEDHPVATAPTCAEAGRWADVQCTLCPHSAVGGAIPKLDPGPIPTYVDTMKHGDVIGGWKVVVTDAKCTTPGKVEVYCIECHENGTTTHTTTKIKDFDPTGIHFIAGATYVKENGSYKIVKGAYVVDRTTLTGALNSCDAENCATAHIANAGGCDESVNNLHAAHYACEECGDIIFFSVRLDHLEGAATCGNPTECTECHKQLKDAVPHDMVRFDPTETVGDDNDCTTAFYHHIYCSKCNFSSKDEGFEWTDEWKEKAGYVDAMEHDYNGLSDGPTCEKDQVCVNPGCEYKNADAVGHENREGYSKVYTNPTCIAKGFWTYKCPAGEACDMYVKGEATIVEEEGVKYAVWTETDDESVFADHDYEVYLTKTGNCLSYNVVVYQCKDCYNTATKDGDGYISHGYKAENFKDPTGHKLVDNNLVPTCTEGGYNWQTCEYCYNATQDEAGTIGMWDQRDWENKLGYTEKEMLDPTGHWYLSTPEEEGAEPEKIFFDLTCVDLEAHNNPTCADCGEQFIAEDYHNISKEYEKHPTCTESGLVWKYCTNDGCGWKDILSVEAATGHNALIWVTDEAATCCKGGSEHLACEDCGEAVKVGEMILTADGMVAATEADLTRTTGQLEHVWSLDITKSEEPTIHSAGKYVYKCISTSHTCPETREEPRSKIDAVEFSATIDNAVKPGHMIFVNGGTIAYTISIDAENKALYGVQLFVNFDNSKLTYVGFDLGEDNENLFGTMDPSGACSTLVGSKGGVVSIMANVNNTADGEVVDAPVNEKLEFVTLYFKINSETVTDNALDKGYETALSMSNIIVINSVNVGDEEDPAIAFANDYETVTKNAAAIRVEKLGDTNVLKDANGNAVLSDGLVNLLDVQYVQNHVLNSTYDARADIDQNGVVNILDIVAIQRYIIFTHTYFEMAASAK